MNWRRATVALAFVAIPVTALLFFGLTRDPGRIPSPLPGRPAPDFALEVMDLQASTPASAVAGVPANSSGPANTIRLAQQRGQVVILNFWASWCLPCRDEHAALMETAAAYRDDGVRFYGILYNDSPGAARRWLAEMGGQAYPTLLDPGTRTAIDYGVYGVPETFFVAPDGRVAYKHMGPVTRGLLVARIEELLPRTSEPE